MARGYRGRSLRRFELCFRRDELGEFPGLRPTPAEDRGSQRRPHHRARRLFGGCGRLLRSHWTGSRADADPSVRWADSPSLDRSHATSRRPERVRARLAPRACSRCPATLADRARRPDGIARSTFEVSLDAYPGEAYVVRATGRVEYANALGAARLAVAARDLERELATTVAHHPNPSNGFELHPLRGRALPPFFLATRPSVCPGDLDRRNRARENPVGADTAPARSAAATCARRFEQGYRRSLANQLPHCRGARRSDDVARQGQHPAAARRASVEGGLMAAALEPERIAR